PAAGSQCWSDCDVELAGLEPAVPPRGRLVGYEGAVRTVLVADDAELNRKLLRSILVPLGVRVHDASDGRQACDEASRLKPDLILIDSVMPVLTGMEAIARMRAMPPLKTTPIISVSASAMAADRDRCLAAGANAFLPKPIDIPTLLDAIAHATGLTWTYRSPTTD